MTLIKRPIWKNWKVHTWPKPRLYIRPCFVNCERKLFVVHISIFARLVLFILISDIYLEIYWFVWRHGFYYSVKVSITLTLFAGGNKNKESSDILGVMYKLIEKNGLKVITDSAIATRSLWNVLEIICRNNFKCIDVFFGNHWRFPLLKLLNFLNYWVVYLIDNREIF